MTERTNEYSVVKRDLSSPYHKDYWEAKKARKQAPLSPKRVTLAKAYFDTEPEEEVNENQGRRVKKEKVKRQRTKGRMKRARRGFMVFLVALFSLLYVLVGALSFLQLDALEEYNSYFSMFTKVEEVMPDDVTPEDIESGDIDYEYVKTDIGANDVIMSFVKMLSKDAVEGNYYFYNECLLGIKGAYIMNQIAYYLLPIIMLLGIIVAFVFFVRAFVSLCTSKRRKLFVLSAILMLVLSLLGILCGFFWSEMEYTSAMAYLNVLTPAAPLQVGYGYLIMTALSILALVASLFAFRSKKKVQ